MKTTIKQWQIAGLEDALKNVKGFKSIVDLFSDLPLVGNENGDVRVCLEDSSIYVWNNNQWNLSSGSGGVVLTKTVSVKVTENGQTKIYTGIRFDSAGDNRTKINRIQLYLNGILMDSELYSTENENYEMVVNWLSDFKLEKDDVLLVQFYDMKNIENVESNVLKTLGIYKAKSYDYLENLPMEEREEGLAYYIIDDQKNYQLIGGVENSNWQQLSGAGGGLLVGTLTSALAYSTDGFSDADNNALATGEQLKIGYTFKSPNLGQGKVYIYFEGNLVYTGSIKQGYNEYVHPDILQKQPTPYKINMVVEDKGGMLTNEIYIKVKVGALELSCTYDDSKEYYSNNYFNIPYTVDSTDTNTAITVKMYVNGNLKSTRNITNTAIVYYFDIGLMTPGKYAIKFEILQGEIIGNTVIKNVVIASSTEPSIYTDSALELSFTTDNSIILPYRLSMAGKSELYVRFYEDEVLVSKGKVKTGQAEWVVGLKSARENPYVYKMTVETVPLSGEDHGEVVGTTYVEFQVTVSEGSYSRQEHVTSGLYGYFKAAGKSNTSTDKNTWNNSVISDLTSSFKIYNGTYGADNGWIVNDTESYLRLNGNSYANIDYQPFRYDYYGMQNGAIGSPYDGFTVQLQIRVNEVGAETTKAISCLSQTPPYPGFYVSTEVAGTNTNLEGITTNIAKDEWTNIAFVINRHDTLEGTGILYIYIDGIISCVKNLTTSDIENFQSQSKIWINAEPDSFGNPSDFGSVDIKTIRIYERSLTPEEVVQNLIADIEDSQLQKEAIEFNNSMSKIPTIKFNREYKDGKPVMEFGEATQKNKVLVKTEYNGVQGVFGESFTVDDYICELAYQGTSTLQYAKKNYKIKLNQYVESTDNVTGEIVKKKSKLKFSPFPVGGNKRPSNYEPWLPESTFTLKVNYMESSQSFNAGMARYVNGIYTASSTKAYVPPQEDPNFKNHEYIRTALDGFPIRVFLDGVDQGVHVMLLDKGADNNLGFDSDYYPYVQSWEMSSNSDSGAGAFRDTSLKAMYSQYECRYIPEHMIDIDSGEIKDIDDTDEYEELWLAAVNDDEIGRQIIPLSLRRLILWVNKIGLQYENATTNAEKQKALDEFRNQIEAGHYLDKWYTIFYYLHTLTWGMVDNYGRRLPY